MACISKLARAIAYNCDGGATGLLSALIINKADIASFVVTSDGTGLSALTIAGGSKAYKIDTVKRSVVVSTALKVNEGAPNAFSNTVTITLTSVTGHTSLSQALSNGSFVVIAKDAAGDCYVYGLYYGLSATAYEHSSHDNGGWITATLETPENVIGEDTIWVSAALYADLYAAAVG
jgi:hypothetical protein